MFNHLKNYLSVTKKEWNGLVILMVLIMLVLATPYVYQMFHKNPAVNAKDFEAAIAKLRQRNLADSSRSTIGKSTLSNFNPNHLPDAQWEKLGLTERQIQVIQNYQSKGGHFYSKQDLQKDLCNNPRRLPALSALH
jgi:competence protein ComEA